jgi:uncharacterized protein
MKFWRAISVSAAAVACVCSAALLWPHAGRTEQPSPSPASTPSISSAPSGQQTSSSQTPTIEEYNPKSTLVVPEHKIQRTKFPFIDIHSHHWNPTPEHVDQLVKEMDTINLRVLVNLSGGTGDELKKTVATMKGRYPDRFVVFANPSYDDINTPGYGQRAAERLAADVRNGAQGLKIFKNFGMDLKYANGERVHADDPIFDPLFEKCAELKLPVLIHIAEPSAFSIPGTRIMSAGRS